MRIVIAMMKHETNTFSPIVTDWDRFQQWGAHQGVAVQKIYAETSMPVTAYLKLAKTHGAEIVTPIAAEAMPSGPVLEQTYEYMAGLICDAVSSGCDAALLDLHGAMVAEHTLDGEGTLLARLRDISPDLPIGVTCDLHCNLTATMIQNATALIGYKTYPHVDKYEVAEQIGTIVLDAVEGRCVPTMSWGNVPLLSQTLCQGTDDEPMKTLIRYCRDAEQHPEILAATAFGGFPMADMRDAGNSVVIVSDQNLQLANQYRDQILLKTWEAREGFVYQSRSLDNEIAKVRLLPEGPILLLDHADNCGSGGTQDVMTVVERVFRAGLEDVIVGAIWDPIAVRTMQEAGVGAELSLDLGGNTDMPSIGECGQPFHVAGTVKVLNNGKWIVRGPMYHGIEINMGPTALLDTGSMAIVVISHHHEPWDQGIFTSVGIQAEHHHYILLKSRIHYRAGFADLARHTVTLDGSGVTTSENSKLDYQHLRRPIYPLDSPIWPETSTA